MNFVNMLSGQEYGQTTRRTRILQRTAHVRGYQSEALINLLDRKDIISKKDLFEEMKRVQTNLVKVDR
jgi:hypothetical protein